MFVGLSTIVQCEEIIATGGQDGTAKIWNLNSGRHLATLKRHGGREPFFGGEQRSVNSVAFNKDATLLVTASNDATAKLWDLRCLSAQKVRCATTLMGHSKAVQSAFFNQAGDYIITLSQDNTIKVWNLRGLCIATVTGYTGDIGKIAFHKRTGVIAVIACDGTTINSFGSNVNNIVNLFNLSGQCVARLIGHTDDIESVCFNKAGDRLITTSYDKTVKLWDVHGNCLWTLTGYRGDPNGCVLIEHLVLIEHVLIVQEIIFL